MSIFPRHGGDSNGMDMSADNPMNLNTGNFLSYLHFTIPDQLWFLGWTPTTAGTMIGTCIGLILLALVERWIAGARTVAERHWQKRIQIKMSDDINTTPEIGRSQTIISPSYNPLKVPFFASHELARGAVQTTQSCLRLLFMLVVMTQQVAFILSLIIGAGFGEALFGRYSHAAAHLS